MIYNKTVKFIILSVLLIIIAFAIGMTVKLNHSSADQRRLQACTEYQQEVNAGNATVANPGCGSK